MPYENRFVERRLLGKFHFREVKGKDDHRWVEVTIPDGPSIRTRISHGRDTVQGDLESRMAKQLKVTTHYFRGMMDCINSCEDYYQMVLDRIAQGLVQI